jgi:hypothetical protein
LKSHRELIRTVRAGKQHLNLKLICCQQES